MAERLVGHHRTEVGAADPDVDDGADRSSREPPPRAGAHGVGERCHPVQHLMDFGHDIDPVDDQRLVPRHPQRHVEHGAILRHIDPLAGEHRVDSLAQTDLARERQQQRHGHVTDQLLGVIEVDAERLRRQAGATLRVVVEHRPQVHRSQRCAMLLQRAPRGAIRQAHGLVHVPSSSSSFNCAARTGRSRTRIRPRRWRASRGARLAAPRGRRCRPRCSSRTGKTSARRSACRRACTPPRR